MTIKKSKKQKKLPKPLNLLLINLSIFLQWTINLDLDK